MTKCPICGDEIKSVGTKNGKPAMQCFGDAGWGRHVVTCTEKEAAKVRAEIEQDNLEDA